MCLIMIVCGFSESARTCAINEAGVRIDERVPQDKAFEGENESNTCVWFPIVTEKRPPICEESVFT
jgi:hypothetical protein